MMRPLDILFILYPNFTQLDFAGPYEVFSRLPGSRVRLASPEGGGLRTEHGLTFSGIERLIDIERCDLLCIPGGNDQSAVTTPEMLKEIRRLASSSQYVTSVCNGSLVLGSAGLLKGVRSACHWAMRDKLVEYGAIPDSGRVVRDGNVITGGGVTAGIDFALSCAADIAGDLVAQAIQLLIEYAPAPPFDAGRPETASPAVMRALHDLIAARAE